MKEQEVIKRFMPDKRMQALIDRRLQLVIDKKRDIYCDNAEFLVYHWSGEAATFSPATGEHACEINKRIEIGDHNARVDIGRPFPKTDEMPEQESLNTQHSIGLKIMNFLLTIALLKFVSMN